MQRHLRGPSHRRLPAAIGQGLRRRDAVIDGDVASATPNFLDRCLRLGGALRNMGVSEGGRVAVLAPIPHVLLEATMACRCGAVLVALNTRSPLPSTPCYVEHSGAQGLIYDFEYEAIARDVAAQRGGGLRWWRGTPRRPVQLLLAGSAPFHHAVSDERGCSRSTTRAAHRQAEGRMYHHRGAFCRRWRWRGNAARLRPARFCGRCRCFIATAVVFRGAVTAAGRGASLPAQFDPAVVWKHLRESNVTPLQWRANGPRHAGVASRRGEADTHGGAWLPAAPPPTPAILQRRAELDGRYAPVRAH